MYRVKIEFPILLDIRWKAFMKKKKALVNVNFEEVINLIRVLFAPIIQSINNGSGFDKNWSIEERNWE